ncbi:hypothetical protein FACS1894179_06010 [Bacteroidia bacterium]|nr:hypothetical protein FACS1894179_06010 [Bacteroidia bacterium]
MNLPIHSLNTRLITYLERENITLGLADGKMGFCIYFYYLSSVYTHTSYRKIAEKLLDDTFENVDAINSIDVKNGLAGIGLGINYLIKNNYVGGNVNIILKDIDDIIFKNLSYFKYSEKIDTLSIIHILYYLSVRLKNQKQGHENEYLFRELIIQTVNNLYERIDLSFYEEPLAYNIDYPLPQLLLVLSEIYQLNFYNYRLIKIIEELSYKVLSAFPVLHSNRLYLLWGMNAIQRQIKSKNWEKHIRLIHDQIDVDIILNQELRDKNIFVNNGYASIYYLMISLKNYFSPEQIKLYSERTLQKIESSAMWNVLQESQYFDRHKGLLSGFSGTALILNLIHGKKQNEHEN